MESVAAAPISCPWRSGHIERSPTRRSAHGSPRGGFFSAIRVTTVTRMVDQVDFDSIDSACPSCGTHMHPRDLPSGAVVLHCTACGQTAI